MDKVVTLGFLSVILVALMIGGLITANVFASRMARVERDKRVNQLVDMSDMSDDFTMRKNSRKEESSSSSSSDED